MKKISLCVSLFLTALDANYLTMLAPSGPKHRYLEVNTVNEERWREGVNERQKQKEDIPSVTDSFSLHFLSFFFTT